MNLYLLSQTDNNGYDTYDSCVVAAESEREAAKIAPGDWADGWSAWAASPDTVEVTLLGISIDDESGIILSSFNAG